MSEQNETRYGADPWLTGPDLDSYLGISHQTRWRWERTGKIPKGVFITKSAKRWRKSWIDKALEKLQGEAA